MIPNDSIEGEPLHRLPTSQEGVAVLHSLTPIATDQFNEQLSAFTLRLADAFLAYSESATDAKEASASFRAGNLLKNNAYAFHYHASSRLEKSLQEQVRITSSPASASTRIAADEELSLVSFDELDQKLKLGNACKPIESANSAQLNAFGVRLGRLLGKQECPLSQNPFRPEIFLATIEEAWAEFNSDTDSHPLLLSLLSPAVFVDLAPIYEALNNALISRAILPELNDSYRIKKSNATQESTKQLEEAQRNEQLRRMLMPGQQSAGMAPTIGGGGGGSVEAPANFANFQQQILQASAVSNQLLGYLAGLQKTAFEQQLSDASHHSGIADASILAGIKAQAPRGALSQADENAIDLLIKVFEVVFSDRHVPSEIKPLIGNLQVPVLKAALIDREFFFQQEHPARRLIELLTKASISWDQQKGKEDPLYKTIHHNVKRVTQEFDQQMTVFSDVVESIETFIKEEEKESAAALRAPISEALRQEKVVHATKSAKSDVAMRVGTGEVAAFVETFLESKWVSVLTLAYSIKEEKPQALESALQTMDDLVWSVKPKITMGERKELIGKLPAMLSALNKGLSVVKLDDAERVQFFAELAECHASIVRAPLELTPKRQLEIAMEAAKKAAERRREKQAATQPEPVDTFTEKVEVLERGTWFEFTQKDDSIKRVKLAWVSPLRSLYIFSTRDKQESFSMSADELAQCMRDGRAHVVLSAGVVDRAIAQSFEQVANDPSIETEKSAA